MVVDLINEGVGQKMLLVHRSQGSGTLSKKRWKGVGEGQAESTGRVTTMRLRVLIYP